MSYIANQYNYATPLSSTTGLVGETSNVADKKYFVLSENTLDGSYSPVSGDVGLWGAATSDSNGVLSEPFVVTITEDMTVNAFRLTSSQYCYPVAFTIVFKNGSTILHTVTETNNTEAEYVAYLAATLTVTEIVVTVTKISKAGEVARLYNVYNPAYVKRVDTLGIKQIESSAASQVTHLIRTDVLRTDVIAAVPDITNTIDTTFDTLNVNNEQVATPTNVHTRMKEYYREIYGKVYITYTDPMLDNETEVLATSEAYNSNKEQLLDGVDRADYVYFTLYDNNLSGEYVVSGVDSQTGWVSGEISNGDGTFTNPPSISVSFTERPIVSLLITFDDSHENLVKDFSVTFVTDNGNKVLTFTDNSQVSVPVVSEPIANVTSIVVTVSRVARGNSPAVIMDMPISSTILYRGYKDASEIMSIDLLEELTYEDDIEALGGVSANEITIVLDNSSKSFFGENSVVSKQLRRNRKIVPWLGVEIVPGEIEWYTLGTFWSYKWDTPVNGLTATVVGFDTISLLDHTPFDKHQVLLNKSIGYLIEYVLNDAKTSLNFIEYVIDPSLYEIMIPYAWFDNSNHGAALRKISGCYPMHIYCDRLGRVCAVPQRLRLDYFYDEWSDSTNVIDKVYSSLHATLPNIINVTVHAPTLSSEELVSDHTVYIVTGQEAKILNFNKPYVSDFNIDVDCDSTLSYAYEVYSWGAVINFTGSGTVRSVVCSGTCVDTSNSSLVTQRDETSIRLDGAVTRNIESDFIQTTELAKLIIGRLSSLSENDKYDAMVNYRGDIALSINDPVLLHNGIAPDNRYNIKRHQLSWNGSLTGSAELNT